MIKVKRAYSQAQADDGFRILVDRLWPRGVSKEKAHISLWLKDIAPSDKLRKWFAHEPEKWDKFKKAYAQELKEHAEQLNIIADRAKKNDVTLVFAAKDEQLNNAVALKEYLERTVFRKKYGNSGRV